MSRTRLSWVLSAAVAMAMLTGCATVFKGTKSDIRFVSQPEGADVYANGRKIGTTPLDTELVSKNTYAIDFKKDGYETESTMVNNGVGTGWVILGIFTGLWPMLIDAITGSWYGLDEDEVHVVMSQKAEAPPPPSGNAYRGERRKISARVKCAAMPMKQAGVDENLSTIIDDVLLSELQQAGFEAIGTEDINAMLGFERAKEAVGCDDATCIAEIGGALGVDYLVSGKVATVEGSPIVTLKIMDVSKARVLARSNRTSSAGEGTVLRLLAEAVQELATRSGL